MILEKLIEKNLKQYYGQSASFREGQLEAIKSVLNKERTLVVQKTGWGKSLIYFLSTRILRDNGYGPTIIISPLLSLMNNQIESARKLNLKALTINSSNKEEWEVVKKSLIKNSCDVLFISPERLGNDEFIKEVLYKINDNIGLFVVDEAHCISDWGHDFRPDYRRIVRIVQMMPMNIPILATTATANDRVIEDIQKQLGADLKILRGTLTRESIAIDVIRLNDQSERLAWLYENINKFKGTGIIYCLTVDDCELVASWLNSKGINVESYHSKFDSETRGKKERDLINNKIKALVATVALGMGFDKPDISFVIHYQRPANVIAYYQQIGRAGRALENSYAILLSGKEDNTIAEYFIRAAFPTFKEMNEVVNILENSEGLSIARILEKVNMKKGRVEKCLKFLEVDGIIYKDKSNYHRSSNLWKPDFNYGESITSIRRHELKRMNDYIQTTDCYMKFIATELDDRKAINCGKCSNCLKRDLLSKSVDRDNSITALNFIKSRHLVIEPRKSWPTGMKIDDKSRISEEFRMEEGLMLSSYGDAGWGQMVADGKYKYNRFSDELVVASYEVLKEKLSEWNIKYIVSVPSKRRPLLVKDFSKRLAIKLGIEYLDILYKKEDTPEQKSLENSYFQCENVIKGFDIKSGIYGNILIIDDMVDSKWTLTYCTYLLKKYGASKVYPFALAKTAGIESGD